MAKVELECAVYGEGAVFPVKIARDAKVGALQKAIADTYKVVSNRVEVYPATLTLYLAKKNGAWLKHDRTVKTFLQGDIDTTYEEMLSSWKLNKNGLFGLKFKPADEEIHILVELPKVAGVARGERKRSAEDLSTVDPQVQSNIWKSVLRISSAVCSGTALVVDRTPTHLYLLTNLYLWDDESFAYHLSDEFKVELKRYSRLHPAMKTSGKRKNDTVGLLEPPIRKSTRKKKASVFSPETLVEQLETSSMSMEEVLKFRLESGICWRSSAAFDFAIFEVAAPQDIQLIRCRMAIGVQRTLHVHMFGFPGALEARGFHHPYAIVPAQVTGWSSNQMLLSSLSAPGLSGSAIVCTKSGVAVGYIGGGSDGSEDNE